MDRLNLADCTVTIDAMGTQCTIAKQIIDQQADYVLRMKENPQALLEETQKAFETIPIDEVIEQTEADHEGNSTQNFAILEKVALNLLKEEISLKRGIKAKDSKPVGINNIARRS